MPRIHEMFGHDKGHSLSKTGMFVAGLECEIESVRGLVDGVHEFKSTADGSLRNHGVEFISDPLPREELQNSFKKLHASLNFYDKSEAFSPRTSTHVHINCRPLTDTQVKNIVMLYALFEEFFFSMVDYNRRGNIHCVPLTETVLSNYYHYDLAYMTQRWHKYTALNLLPLAKLGTLEFRHMQGTDNPNLMEEWLTTLENLWTLGQAISITPEALGNKEEVQRWFTTIFKASPKILALKPCLDEMLQNSLIDVKLSLV